MDMLLGLLLLSTPLLSIVLTIWNIVVFLRFLLSDRDTWFSRLLEPIAVLLGIGALFVYTSLMEIQPVEWSKQLYNDQKHFFLSLERLPVLYVLLAAVLLAYLLLRYIPTAKLPPLVVAFGIAGAYIGTTLCILFLIQTKLDPWMFLLFLNIALILVKTVCIVVRRRNAQLQSGEHSTKFKWLAMILNKGSTLPMLGFLALIPLMGVILVIITLFGQQPSDVIKLWTETADWTLSQRIAPQNIFYDEHYLCTVAAGGHRKVVKPLRTGMRRGHRVLVNRQLCVANAFEEVIQQRTPRFHKLVRTVYDRTGYPIAKHIRSRYVADAVYMLMKPLEWLFVLFLYATCAHPEDRIAVQYPHSQPPRDHSRSHSERI